jgi:hypothetical protein
LFTKIGDSWEDGGSETIGDDARGVFDASAGESDEGVHGDIVR